MQTLPALAMEWVVVVFVAGIGALILYKIVVGQIDLSGLLLEPPPGQSAASATTTVAAAGGATPAATPAVQATTVVLASKASMSRLQFLLFTFVIVGLFLTLSMEAGALVEIPNQVLGLLGISGGSYVISKGIQANS